MFLKKKKRIEYLRAVWGKQIDKYRNFDLISAYHAMVAHSVDAQFVDLQTWSDLDFDAVFTRLDRNISGIGQQYLYHLLHKYEDDESVLRQRHDLVLLVKANERLRENIQLGLDGLSGISSYFIANLLISRKLPYTKFYPLFYLCPILSAASLLLIPVNGVFLFAAIGIAITNIIINKIFSNRIYDYFAGFSGLNALIVAALRLSRIESARSISGIEKLKRYRGLLVSLKKNLGYFVIDKDTLPEMGAIVIEYLNMLFLFDIIAYYRSVATLLKYQTEIHEVYKAVAELDAAVSIASYLEEIPYYSTPVFHETGIRFQDLYHPLIPDAVSNSMDQMTDSILITGSNMSGKTTFMKTVGLNIILARTLHFCLARSMAIPKLFVKTSIRRNEDLNEGKSYFFAEIESLHAFMELSVAMNRYLFLIDEIFRGTNTIERLASATAVLKYLDASNTVFVTTHDIELQDLLKNNYHMYHFSEQVEEGRYFFNYRIQEGPCSSGNAVRLLEIMGYPESVITDARVLIGDLLHH